MASILRKVLFNAVTGLQRTHPQKNSLSSLITYQRGLSTSHKLSDIFTIQDENDFKEKVVKSKRPVVIEFHATWCGPCKVLMPRMEKVMINFKDSIDLALVDIDEFTPIALEYNIGAVPSVLLMKNGEVLDKFVGLKEEDQIQTFISGANKK